MEVLNYIIWAFMFLIAEGLLFAVQVPLRLRDSHVIGVIALVAKALLVIFLAYGLVATTSAFWWNHSLFFGALYCALIGDFVASVAWSFVRLAQRRQSAGEAPPRPDKSLRRQRPVAMMSLLLGAVIFVAGTANMQTVVCEPHTLEEVCRFFLATTHL